MVIKDSIGAFIRFTTQYLVFITQYHSWKRLTESYLFIKLFVYSGFYRYVEQYVTLNCSKPQFRLPASILDLITLISSTQPFSQSCAVAESEKFWWATGQSNLAHKWLAATKASNVWFSYAHYCTFWPMEQSSILSAKFYCPMAGQKFSFLATAHACETGLMCDSNASNILLSSQ